MNFHTKSRFYLGPRWAPPVLATCVCAGLSSDQFMFQFVGAVAKDLILYIQKSITPWEHK